jgi:hypothetical protein
LHLDFPFRIGYERLWDWRRRSGDAQYHLRAIPLLKGITRGREAREASSDRRP